jgi:hypothetical protein
VQSKKTELIEMIESRWFMLHTCVHGAGYLLDPEYHGEKQESNEEVMSSFVKFVAKVHHSDEDKQADALAQYEKYLAKDGLFAHATAWVAARRMPPHAWWQQFGAGVPDLQVVAVRALAQVKYANTLDWLFL